MKLEISPKQVISDFYMVLSLLTFLQSCQTSFSTPCDARELYNTSSSNGDLTILHENCTAVWILYIECSVIYGCMARRTRLAVKQWAALAK
jgi:hypothetical protein